MRMASMQTASFNAAPFSQSGVRSFSAIFVNLLCGFSMLLYGKGRVLCLSRRFARFFRIVRNFSVVYFAAVCYNE